MIKLIPVNLWAGGFEVETIALTVISCSFLVIGILAFSLGSFAWASYNKEVETRFKKLLVENKKYLNPEHQIEVNQWWVDYKAKTTNRFVVAGIALIISLILALYANRFPLLS